MVVEWLFGMYKSLDLIPVTTKKTNTYIKIKFFIVVWVIKVEEAMLVHGRELLAVCDSW